MESVIEKIIASMKQFSNSFYWSSLLAEHKYWETIYTGSEQEVKTFINQPELQAMECIGNNWYKVQRRKKVNVHSLPIELGAVILNEATVWFIWIVSYNYVDIFDCPLL